jgi:predicted N-acetyltransferase YhbS
MRYLPQLAREQVVAVSRQNHALWGGGRSQAEHGAYALRQLEVAGPELLRYVGLADRRGRVVGSIKRYALLLRDGSAAGGALRAVGIGAVFTAPSARGRGVASALVGAVLDEARALGYAAALLYSDIDPAFYARLGFVALPARDWSLPAGALPARGALPVRRAVEGDLDRLLGWYEDAWDAGHPTLLRPARSRALFRYFSFRNRLGAPWIVRWRGRDAGYVMAGPDDPRRDLPDPRAPGLFWFDEAAAPGVPRERLWATVGALAREARAKEVYGWLGPEGAPEGAARRARPGAFPMIAPLAAELRVRTRRAWLDSFQHF